MKRRRNYTRIPTVPRDADPPNVQLTERAPSRPTDDVEGFCHLAPPPSTIRELNFDDVGRRAIDGRRVGARIGAPHHHTQDALDALIEPPANGLAPFLSDPSLLPKRPPCAARPE